MVDAVAKPAWYDDPAARHRLRYWDGEHWTAHVSDLGEMSLDELPAAPSSPPLESAVAPPPPASPHSPGVVPPPPQHQTPRRESRRPRRRWLVVGIAGAAVLGLVAGLLAWVPRTPRVPSVPTVLRGESVTATSVLISWKASTGGAKVDRYVILRGGVDVATVPGGTTSYRDQGLRPGTDYRYRVAAEHGTRRSNPSVATVATTIAPSPVDIAVRAISTTATEVRWSRPPGAPRPDEYVILRDGASVATVAGRVSSYKDTGLRPGTTFEYGVAAVWAGHRSTPSTASTVKTPTPPVPAARLQGSFQVYFRITSSPGGNVSAGTTWNSLWKFSPKCTSGACAVSVSGFIAPDGFIYHVFAANLARNGAAYTGTSLAHITHCGAEPNVVEVTNQITLQIAVAAAQMNGAGWYASRLTGTMTVSSPYTQAGRYFCPAQSIGTSLTATR